MICGALIGKPKPGLKSKLKVKSQKWEVSTKWWLDKVQIVINFMFSEAVLQREDWTTCMSMTFQGKSGRGYQLQMKSEGEVELASLPAEMTSMSLLGSQERKRAMFISIPTVSGQNWMTSQLRLLPEVSQLLALSLQWLWSPFLEANCLHQHVVMKVQETFPMMSFACLLRVTKLWVDLMFLDLFQQLVVGLTLPL